ncbi:hypothetical protein HMPREF0299_5427 [Corynebacterium matruchotii ATCC 14266]|uniref:Uncharacterized protein n=1 Tax=Corynebacterium matruchotii ATCC 14266 TaxID=553207 RepID=E0DIB6_9CORY|nr:hypothetical protein HMPREF0299_5427 [Corynebacterium matruchotii ATCC 14266]
MMVAVMSSPVAEKTGRMIRMPNGTGEQGLWVAGVETIAR